MFRKTTKAPDPDSAQPMSELADRHLLYQYAVQDVEAEIDFVEQTWSELRQRPAVFLREDFLHGNVKSLFVNVKQLSKVVLTNFKPMIPKSFHTIWRKGIDTNAYYLKLCGSGGGGYILGFTEDFELAKNLLKDYKLELVYRF